MPRRRGSRRRPPAVDVVGPLQLECRVEGAQGRFDPSSLMRQVMRISRVAIISMLTPASARAPNMRAA